jgi:hypothetical protein
MIESTKFLSSLAHDNPHRPHFSIRPGLDVMLEIEHRGQSIQLPLSEILNFASRWQADYSEQEKQVQSAGGLCRFPYPLYNVSLNDPDVPDYD